MDLGDLCLGHFFDFDGFKTREDDSMIGKDTHPVLCQRRLAFEFPDQIVHRPALDQRSCLLPSTFTCTTYIAALIAALCSGVIDNVVEVKVVTMVTVSQKQSR